MVSLIGVKWLVRIPQDIVFPAHKLVASVRVKEFQLSGHGFQQAWPYQRIWARRDTYIPHPTTKSWLHISLHPTNQIMVRPKFPWIGEINRFCTESILKSSTKNREQVGPKQIDDPKSSMKPSLVHSGGYTVLPPQLQRSRSTMPKMQLYIYGSTRRHQNAKGLLGDCKNGHTIFEMILFHDPQG